MDPLTLVLSALAAGAAHAAKGVAGEAVKDAYAGLKGLVRRKLAKRDLGEAALAGHERDPETWKAPLAKELAAVGAHEDEQLVRAAQALMKAVDPDGFRAGVYNIRGGDVVADRGGRVNAETIDTGPKVDLGRGEPRG